MQSKERKKMYRLVIDCQTTGISGDMLLSSLADLATQEVRRRIVDCLYSCQDAVSWLKIHDLAFKQVSRSGFKAMQLSISYEQEEEEGERRGVEVYDAVARCCKHLSLSKKAESFALKSMEEIVKAEAVIHMEDRSTVHLHEISSADTVVDIVGTALALQELNLLDDDVEIYATRVAVGGGYVSFSHGTVSNPASAILEIFKGRRFTLIGGPVDHELTTPTGAAMLVSLARCSLDFYPALECVNVGYGAGMQEFTTIPNLLKVVLGRVDERYARDSIIMLETNLDDVEGELIAGIVDRLMSNGARDISVIQAIGKKGRPSYILRVLCNRDVMNNLLAIIFRESGTLGVRVQEYDRYILAGRDVLDVPVMVRGREFRIRAKVAKDSDGRVVHVKAEYDDVASMADALGLPYRIAYTMACKSISSMLNTCIDESSSNSDDSSGRRRDDSDSSSNG
ncbi:MAG: nickel pincer cofactor biosynthesis protein LarC [Candidatus Nitrosocaldus sp.]